MTDATLKTQVSNSLASAVRGFRAAKSWTLDELAARSGVSRRLIVQIEKGEANPSIGSLLRLGEALEVTLTELIAPDPTKRFGTRGPSQQSELWQGPAGGSGTLEVSRGPLELWSWRLEPGESHESEAHQSGALELVRVEKGTLTLEFDAEILSVRAGHAAWFEASQRHAYRNAAKKPVTFTLVVFDPANRRTDTAT
jgi:transcriptional regulator with XRE-family HTH domain